jgi:hypothetical protein
MKKSNYLLACALAASLLHTAAQAADVGVSINVSQPGFYGRIDVGRVPGPMVIYPQPIIIEQRPMTVVRQPIYLRVPPGHEKNWGRYCNRYGACGQPVYFVQDNWYREVYAPRFYEDRGGRDQGRDNGRGHGKKMKKEHGGD